MWMFFLLKVNKPMAILARSFSQVFAFQQARQHVTSRHKLFAHALLKHEKKCRFLRGMGTRKGTARSKWRIGKMLGLPKRFFPLRRNLSQPLGDLISRSSCVGFHSHWSSLSQCSTLNGRDFETVDHERQTTHDCRSIHQMLCDDIIGQGWMPCVVPSRYTKSGLWNASSSLPATRQGLKSSCHGDLWCCAPRGECGGMQNRGHRELMYCEKIVPCCHLPLRMMCYCWF